MIQNTLVYWLAVEISGLTHIFCERYIDKRSRTFDQMIQADRSGKQNIVEGSLENSTESNLKLTGVARASYGELIEDFRDFLWKKGLPVWNKDDPRVMSIRRKLIDIHETHVSHDAQKWYVSHGTHESHESHVIFFDNPEAFANLMISLCTKQGFLLDRFLKGIKERFIREGGFRERLFQERRQYHAKNH
ncbi:MAG: hypothetical protein A3D92_23120 [Bacteroidetes bacterium RIFCSPHIGHO2_02_FULL_44_7]|nr:MAG: hypothetical protein A3D92_23120 [Bacteroidetes bacterium RIFCSPHIGHO2_02_FULL_44_7]